MPNLRDFLKQPLILKSICVLIQDNLVCFKFLIKWKEIRLSRDFMRHFRVPSVHACALGSGMEGRAPGDAGLPNTISFFDWLKFLIKIIQALH